MTINSSLWPIFLMSSPLCTVYCKHGCFGSVNTLGMAKQASVNSLKEAWECAWDSMPEWQCEQTSVMGLSDKGFYCPACRLETAPCCSRLAKSVMLLNKVGQMTGWLLSLALSGQVLLRGRQRRCGAPCPAAPQPCSTVPCGTSVLWHPMSCRWVGAVGPIGVRCCALGAHYSLGAVCGVREGSHLNAQMIFDMSRLLENQVLPSWAGSEASWGLPEFWFWYLQRAVKQHLLFCVVHHDGWTWMIKQCWKGTTFQDSPETGVVVAKLCGDFVRRGHYSQEPCAVGQPPGKGVRF